MGWVFQRVPGASRLSLSSHLANLGQVTCCLWTSLFCSHMGGGIESNEVINMKALGQLGNSLIGCCLALTVGYWAGRAPTVTSACCPSSCGVCLYLSTQQASGSSHPCPSCWLSHGAVLWIKTDYVELNPCGAHSPVRSINPQEDTCITWLQMVLGAERKQNALEGQRGRNAHFRQGSQEEPFWERIWFLRRFQRKSWVTKAGPRGEFRASTKAPQ